MDHHAETRQSLVERRVIFDRDEVGVDEVVPRDGDPLRSRHRVVVLAEHRGVLPGDVLVLLRHSGAGVLLMEHEPPRLDRLLCRGERCHRKARQDQAGYGEELPRHISSSSELLGMTYTPRSAARRCASRSRRRSPRLRLSSTAPGPAAACGTSRRASDATVGPSKMLTSETSTPSSFLSREMTRMAISELPPRSKKLSWTPICWMPSSSCQTPAIWRSASLCGAT